MTNLIALCGSHLGNLIKIKWMDEMINSWVSQSFHIPLYISVSLDESVKSIFEHYVSNKWNSENMKALTFFVSDTKISQFQHYKILCEKMMEKYSRNIWVMFTDDDDIWEKDRSLYYKTLINNLQKMGKENETSHIQIPTYCVNYKNNFDDNYEMRNLDHITIGDSSHQHLDYWQFSCQIKYLKDFIDKASLNLLNDGFCNLYFVKYFYSDKTKAYRWYTKDKKRFVYYWRGSAGHQSNDNIHLLNQLKKKSMEETLVKLYLQEEINSKHVQKKNKEEIKKYTDRFGKNIPEFNNKKMKDEINNLFYSDKYDHYINSPILEGIIE
jgi:hypothetical protein